MGEPFVENGCEAVNYLTEKYWDQGFDAVTRTLGIGRKADSGDRTAVARRGYERTKENTAPVTSAAGGRRGREKNEASFSSYTPSSLRSIEAWEKDRYREQVKGEQQANDSRLDRQSEHSEQVIRAYQLDPSDPVRRPNNNTITTTKTTLLNANNPANTRRTGTKMSYQNGGLAPGQYPYQQQRANSAQPPRTRYQYDDDDEYGSDYDDRRGSRYQTTGRGYDDRDRGYDDRGGGYDDGNYREVIETERYKGPARDFDQRRQSFRSQDPYQGAMTQYNQQSQQRRSTTDIDTYARRSRSRGRRYSERDRGDSRSRSRSRSYSRSRSRSRSGEGREKGLRGEVGRHFDTSLQGIGVGLAGAVVGGMAGRHFGERNPRHKNRDILLGALVGGLGANAAEKQWTHWQDEKREKIERDEERWEGRYDGGSRGGGGGDYGRSRSAMR